MITVEEYELKRQTRYNRLLEAARKADTESEARLKHASQMANNIPFGQPILVGHHSESRDRNYRGRIHNGFRKGYELAKKAEEYRSRAASINANDSIYSDDPQASEKLGSKLTVLKDKQAEMKRINAALRKGADFETLEMSDEHRAELRLLDRVQGYFQPLKKGFPPYKLTNLNAKIKAAEKREKIVEDKQSTPDKDEEINGIKIEWRASENRIRIYFPARVDLEMFKKLKSHGYRVLRSKGEGAFSAYYNYNSGTLVRELREANK